MAAELSAAVLAAEVKRLQRLVRDALCMAEMDSGDIAQWLRDNDVPDLDDPNPFELHHA